MQILFAIGLLLLYDLIELPAAVLVGPDTEVSLNKADYQYDMQTYEHYTIWDCGENAEQLYRALHVMSGELYLAKHDAKEGIESNHGYNAFFKANRYKDFISGMLNIMEYGMPAEVFPPRGPLPSLAPTNPVPNPRIPSPHLICAKERTSTVFKISFDVDAYCARHPEQHAFTVKLSAYIIICPSFWNTRVSPDLRIPRCPSVKANRFEGYSYYLRNGILQTDEEDRLIGLRHYRLLHEIVFHYLQYLSLAIDTQPRETFDWNECVALDPGDSWRNPENWVLYVASVEARCTDFPEYRFPGSLMPPMINLTKMWPY